MPERAKEMIEESLRLALFVSAQCLREANEFTESALQLVTHSDMLTKKVAADKLRSAPPVVASLPLCAVL
jgi:hypothetical protein